MSWYLLNVLTISVSIGHILKTPYNPIVSNLNHQIDIFAKRKCFLLLDNHEGIDILPFAYPIVVRKIKSFKGFKNMTLKLISMTELSNYYSQFAKPKPGINFFEFASSHKPWNCLVHLQVYPDLLEYYENYVHPYVFQFKASYHPKYVWVMEPSTIPLWLCIF